MGWILFLDLIVRTVNTGVVVFDESVRCAIRREDFGIMSTVIFGALFFVVSLLFILAWGDT